MCFLRIVKDFGKNPVFMLFFNFRRKKLKKPLTILQNYGILNLL